MFLSICSLFKDAISTSAFITSNDWLIVNNKLKRMWNELFVIQFKVLSRNLPVGTEESAKCLGQDSRCSDPDSNNAPSEYKSEALSFDTTFLVILLNQSLFSIHCNCIRPKQNLKCLHSFLSI
jgi:hypothetical protein